MRFPRTYTKGKTGRDGCPSRPPAGMTHDAVSARGALPRKRSAFTLIEIMVSIAILSVVVLSLGRIFTLTTDSTARARSTIQLDQTARQFFGTLSHDLSQAYVRTNMPFHVKTVNGIDTLAFVTASRIGLEANANRDYLAESRDSHAVTYSLQSVGPDLFYIERTSPLLIDDGSAANAAMLFHDASDFYGNTDDIPMGLTATEALTSALIPAEDTDSGRGSTAASQIIVQSVTYRINGRNTPADDHQYQPNQLIDLNDIPRFVDVDLELISKRDWDLYTLLYDNGNTTAADKHLQKNLRVYARRFPLNTRPVESLDLNSL